MAPATAGVFLYNRDMIVGIDEVGRGPWAGPIVFGAVVLGDTAIEGLTDSKKLSKKRREQLACQIYDTARAVGLGWVAADELDQLGMPSALSLACRRALEKITVPYDQIIIDGTINFLKDTGKGPYVTTLAKADLLVESVSAASIVAKVARDAFMAEQDVRYPGYGFGAHAGYGTAAHRQALEAQGVTPLHRRSFAPIAALLEDRSAQSPSDTASTTKAAGDRAEAAAAEYMLRHGFSIVARNWRTKAGEIDIVAKKEGVIHFVEVKYRRSVHQGGGIAAITPRKLHHMERAGKLWLQRHGDTEACLSVIEVSGPTYTITRFIEALT